MYSLVTAAVGAQLSSNHLEPTLGGAEGVTHGRRRSVVPKPVRPNHWFGQPSMTIN